MNTLSTASDAPLVVITGASKGLGRSLCFRFAQAGFRLAINARKQQDLVQLCADIKKELPNADIWYQVCDVCDKEQLARFADALCQDFGQVQVLINNAGFYAEGSLCTEPDGLIEQMMQTNLYAPYYLTRFLLPLMQHNKGHRHIFNIGSIASTRLLPDRASYTISKQALHAFSQMLRNELQASGIGVTSVLPGAIQTYSWEGGGGEMPPRSQIMSAESVAEAIYCAYTLAPHTIFEVLQIQAQLGL